MSAARFWRNLGSALEGVSIGTACDRVGEAYHTIRLNQAYGMPITVTRAGDEFYKVEMAFGRELVSVKVFCPRTEGSRILGEAERVKRAKYEAQALMMTFTEALIDHIDREDQSRTSVD
jgi:hypothetical protein